MNEDELHSPQNQNNGHYGGPKRRRGTTQKRAVLSVAFSRQDGYVRAPSG